MVWLGVTGLSEPNVRPRLSSQRVFSRRRERCEARKDDGSVHRTLSKSDRRLATRSSLMNTLSRDAGRLDGSQQRAFGAHALRHRFSPQETNAWANDDRRGLIFRRSGVGQPNAFGRW